jgi:hypothetical protein
VKRTAPKSMRVVIQYRRPLRCDKPNKKPRHVGRMPTGASAEPRGGRPSYARQDHWLTRFSRVSMFQKEAWLKGRNRASRGFTDECGNFSCRSSPTAYHTLERRSCDGVEHGDYSALYGLR